MKVSKLISRFSYKKALKKLNIINGYRIRKTVNLQRIGTNYGGWIVPGNFFKMDSVCYLAGAGEDISFDVGLAEKYSCNVNIFDPTPRAKIHFDNLVEAIQSNRNYNINNDPSQQYSIPREIIPLLHFHELGLWNEAAEIKFFAPQNTEHVSHSILNLQKTVDFFIGKVDRLSNIMKVNGHKYLDLLKIDIEGAEYEVIKTIIEDKLDIKIICVEFDEAYNPIDSKSVKRIRSSIDSLVKQKYVIVLMDEKYNITFMRKDVYKTLPKK